ncbi:hypothetical protein COW53_09680 [bacterium CG17_big_fil_post_rev_8_21_14_2_50_64_8]|nr:MAG: hypothetical protein COW53_09680 [bacterium CG17_big_fil_post_rev_8_21_14_2_50_64_8]PJA74618.1 MAG: hypothetical protein CO151_09080 [bacterium CG_4_9_14_3_um_filter_65_15]
MAIHRPMAAMGVAARCAGSRSAKTIRATAASGPPSRPPREASMPGRFMSGLPCSGYPHFLPPPPWLGKNLSPRGDIGVRERQLTTTVIPSFPTTPSLNGIHRPARNWQCRREPFSPGRGNPMRNSILILLSLLLYSSTATAQIAINEVLGDPARDWDGDGAVNARGDEWVEIINLGAVAVDLQDYWLRDDSSYLPDYGLSGLLAAGGVKVVYGSDVTAWQSDRGWLETGFGINNSGGDRIYLMSGPYSEILDYQILEQVWVGDHEAEDDRSSGRDPVTGEWVLFDGLNPYSGSQTPQGNGCAPTPGGSNACEQPVPDQTTSFGAMKATYR